MSNAHNSLGHLLSYQDNDSVVPRWDLGFLIGSQMIQITF
jgi:hypothetical protein